MKRREFIKIIIAAAAFVWPLAVRAEMPVIGYLSARSPEDTGHLVEAFRRGLGEAGFVEGQNVMVEYRWARGQQDRLPDLAADLVRKQVLEPKRLELLRELLPNVSAVGALLDPNFPPYEAQLRDLREAARALGLQVQDFRVSDDAAIDKAFETIASQKIGAVIVVAGPFFDTRRDKIVGLAARHAVPTMYHFREFSEAGGLISYGIDSRVTYRQIGVYAGGILKGEKPADLPVRQPTKFELVINLKTAKTLGLKVPLTLQVAADDVIE